jgi:GntR family transcriptional regulator
MNAETPLPRLDRDGPTPIYQQVADHIAARIEADELPAGRRLDPERDLAANYGVAFGTVRRAIEELRVRGLVQTVHGRGTFVRSA